MWLGTSIGRTWQPFRGVWTKPCALLTKNPSWGPRSTHTEAELGAAVLHRERIAVRDLARLEIVEVRAPASDPRINAYLGFCQLERITEHVRDLERAVGRRAA